MNKSRPSHGLNIRSFRKGGSQKMPNTVKTANQKIMRPPHWRMLVAAMAVVAVTNAAFMFSMIGKLGWKEALLVVVSAALLTGGATFTAVTMRDLYWHDR
jgi:anti-sigma-K factor RskA